ncbi:hypothetical protein [Gracilibacillus thailandensis]|uniref:Uncharacterized protein n=1 Tax=Gracilibacillus thailandensis TaxID=563735 RepID=A0A6N7QW45_9BACI|nr:hypothetical protein [Gracilibacillus thailandensis]MRI65115.1 hypothetical protein [Gracilibacillus thailandensis]
MLSKHYPRVYVKEVEEEIRCIEHCAERMQELAKQGDTDTMLLFATNLVRSARALDDYAKVKKEYNPVSMKHYKELTDFQVRMMMNER